MYLFILRYTLLQLAYMSKSTPKSPDVHTLSRQVSPPNFAEEITGILLHRNGHFLHIIEGRKEYVENLFLRIIADDRHTDLHLLFRKSVTCRQFSSSSMMIPTSALDQNKDIDMVREAMAVTASDVRVSFESTFSLDV